MFNENLKQGGAPENMRCFS